MSQHSRQRFSQGRVKAAEAAIKAVKAARITILGHFLFFGVTTCGAALGDAAYAAAFLDAQAERLCNDHDSETPGAIPKVAVGLSPRS